MMTRLLVKLFGGIWKLKISCQQAKPPILRKILRLIYKQYQRINCSGIAWNSTLLGEPCTPHGIFGIFVSGEAVVGRNCVIFQQVTIGSNAIPTSKGFGAPRIGDNCYIASGAKIIGNVKVGSNVRIGANTVVYKDVPDNSVVVSNSQSVLQKDETLDNRFYTFGGSWGYFDDGNLTPVSDRKLIERLDTMRNLKKDL